MGKTSHESQRVSEEEEEIWTEKEKKVSNLDALEFLKFQKGGNTSQPMDLLGEVCQAHSDRQQMAGHTVTVSRWQVSNCFPNLAKKKRKSSF